MDEIIEGAVYFDKLKKQNDWGEERFYAPNEQSPFTGWSKAIHKNGQVQALAQFKDGKQNGLMTRWHENGRKWSEMNFKDGKQDGFMTAWYENGQKQNEGEWKMANWKGFAIAGMRTA